MYINKNIKKEIFFKWNHIIKKMWQSEWMKIEKKLVNILFVYWSLLDFFRVMFLFLLYIFNVSVPVFHIIFFFADAFLFYIFLQFFFSFYFVHFSVFIHTNIVCVYTLLAYNIHTFRVCIIFLWVAAILFCLTIWR